MVLKKSKSREKKKKEERLDILRKKHICAVNTNTLVKQIYGFISDLCTSS